MRLRAILHVALGFLGLPALAGLAVGEDRVLENQAIYYRIGARRIWPPKPIDVVVRWY